MNKSRILCVHESGSVLNELQHSLVEAGCGVVLANNSEHALHVLEQQHVDGIVLSYDMQAPDGRLLRNLLQHTYPEVPLLLFSQLEEIRNSPLHVFSAFVSHPQDEAALAYAE